MSTSRDLGYRLRWVLLAAAMLCWMAGAFWLINVVWPEWEIFQSDGLGTGAGLIGVMGWWFDHVRSYVLAVAAFCGGFFLTQWFFLGPRCWWRMRLTDTGQPMKRQMVVAGLMAGLLTVGLAASLLELAGWWRAMAYSERPPGEVDGSRFWPPLLLVAVMWTVWTVVFAIYWRQGDRYNQLGRMVRGLIAGSVLELLITIPIHVRALRTDTCYCTLGTYTGLVLGGSVLLWAFGPGLVLLFLREKYRRERLLGGICAKCGYDLRGSVAAGRHVCPECGTSIPEGMPKDA